MLSNLARFAFFSRVSLGPVGGSLAASFSIASSYDDFIAITASSVRQLAELDLYIVALDDTVEPVDLCGRDDRRHARANVKPPPVPGTRYDVSLQCPLPERTTAVWTDIVGCV